MRTVEVRVRIVKEVRLKSPVLIEGLPGLGLVGRIAAEHLLKQLRAKKFAEIHSPEFPPHVLIVPDGTIRLIHADLYYWKAAKRSQHDLIILIGDSQGVLPTSFYPIAEKVLDVAQEHGCEFLITLGGFGVGRMSKTPRVFGAATDKQTIAAYKKFGVSFENKAGTIVGAAGLLLGLGMLRGMRGICLMGETHGNYVDARAAKSVLSVLSKALNLNVGLDELDRRAKETEEMISRFEEIQKQAAPVPQAPYIAKKDESTSYIR